MTSNTYLKRREKRLHGQQAERRAAKRLKGRQTPGSGAMVGAKGDIRKNQFLIESKATVNGSLGVKLAWLQKISQEARGVSKDPALCIQFVSGNGVPVLEGSWVLIPERIFKELADEFS